MTLGQIWDKEKRQVTIVRPGTTWLHPKDGPVIRWEGPEVKVVLVRPLCGEDKRFFVMRTVGVGGREYVGVDCWPFNDWVVR